MYASPPETSLRISNAEFQFANKVLEYSSSTCVRDICRTKTLEDHFDKVYESKERGNSSQGNYNYHKLLARTLPTELYTRPQPPSSARGFIG